jgi:hypothetical protein
MPYNATDLRIKCRARVSRKAGAMATLSDEHLRALRFLARYPGGCTEATLLEQGFTAAQLGYLVYAGFAKLRRGGGYAKVFRMKITAAGREAIAE